MTQHDAKIAAGRCANNNNNNHYSSCPLLFSFAAKTIMPPIACCLPSAASALSPEEEEAAAQGKDVDKQLELSRHQEALKFKILLLGSGECGTAIQRC